MATTSNLFSGNGSTTAFTITFPYINTTDVKAKVGGSAVTNFSVSGQTVTFSSAPASGSSNVEIFRETDNNTIRASFQSGSSLRAADFNDNFTQVLYVSQESDNDAADAVTSADAAVVTANTASTNATNAVNTANTASTNASTALSTANTANSTANTASTNASTALSTANTASTNATNAVSTANTASTNASTALSTANTASTTANTASTNASNAVTTANAASAAASAAQTAVASAVLYTPVANVAAIPGSPSDGDYVEVLDSTGIESFSPLSGLPSGFVGASGLTVKLKYVTNSWVWQQYFATDSETRYINAGAGAIVNADVNTSAAIDLSKLATGALPSGITVVSGNITDGTIVNADINDSAAIALSKLATGALPSAITVASANITDGTIVDADINGSAAIAFSKLATGALPSAITVASANITDGTIVNADVNASAAIAGTKISPDFGSQNVVTTGSATIGSGGAFQVDSSGVIQTNISSTGHIKLDSTGTFSSPKIDFRSNTGNAFFQGQVAIGLSTVNAEPATPLTLKNTASGSEHTFLDMICDTNETNRIRFSEDGSTYAGEIRYDTFTNFLSFNTNSGERLRIDSTGRMGLGTSAPASKVHIVGEGAANGTTLNIVDSASNAASQHIRLLRGANQVTMGIEGSLTGDPFFLDRSASKRDFMIANNGDVGIGKIPTTKLDVNGTTFINNGFLHVGNSTATSLNDRVVQVGDTSRSATYLELRTSTTGTGGIVWSDATGNDPSGYRGNIEYSHANDDMLFYTSSSPVLRLDSDGMCRIRGTTTSGSLNVFTSEGAATNKNLILGQHSAAGVGGSGASLSFLVKTNGDVTNSNNSYGAISDINLKENIRDIESQWDDVKAVRLVKYEFKDKEAYGEGDRLGVIAQELEEISPSLVVDDIHTKTTTVPVLDDEGNPALDEEGNELTEDQSEEVSTKAVKYSVLTLKFMGALQEAMQRIEVLEQRLAELEA